MLTNDDQKYWGPLPDITGSLSALIPEGAKVLEIGPGSVPFFRSTHFVDANEGENTVVCNVEHEPLPFEDKFFDFVYCRHIAEDLNYPRNFMLEMSRVGKAGYIETPSPSAEICRGVDGNSPPWRGYHHHHWLVYENDQGVLSFMKKYPVIEHTVFENEAFFESALRHSPYLWNTYFLWEGEIKWQKLDANIVYGQYGNQLFEAARQSIDSTNRTIQRLAAAVAKQSVNA